jgi:Ni/Fe-hydrogenase subunit HybB-like protein
MNAMQHKFSAKALLYLVACAILLGCCVLWLTGVLMFTKTLRSQMAQGMETSHSWMMIGVGAGALLVTLTVIVFFFRRYRKLSKAS